MNKPLDFEQELERRKKNQRLANAIFAVDGLKTYNTPRKLDQKIVVNKIE